MPKIVEMVPVKLVGKAFLNDIRRSSFESTEIRWARKKGRRNEIIYARLKTRSHACFLHQTFLTRTLEFRFSMNSCLKCLWNEKLRYWKTSKYMSYGAFLSVQRACWIPIVLQLYLERYSLFCVLTSILSHLMTSSVPNLHNTKILNVSGTRWDMTKRKTPFFFPFKGLSNSPIFQYLNFSFHRHFKS